jgi:RNA polymerase sigma-70 factor (ECF subfamily)
VGKLLFEELVLPCLDDLYRAARRLERDPDLAGDLLQQALLVGFQRFHQLRSRESFRAWMVTILRRTHLNRVRTPSREISLDEGALPLDDSTADGFDPELRFLTARLRDELRAALDRLPEEQRLAVYLVDVEGFKYAEAANALEVSPGTVASRVARGRRSLQRTLAHLARERGWVVDDR